MIIKTTCNFSFLFILLLYIPFHSQSVFSITLRLLSYFLLFQLIQNHKYCSHFPFQIYSFFFIIFFIVFRRSMHFWYSKNEGKKSISSRLYLSHINQTLEICNTFCLSFTKYISFRSPQSITWSWS